MAIEVTDSNFDKEVLQSTLPVLVDFWAPWCGPCRAIGPIIEELSELYAGKVKICKFDVDSGSIVSAKYGIRAVPTLIFFKNGEVAHQTTGAVSKSSLKEVIDTKMLG